MLAANPTRPLSRCDQQLARLKARRVELTKRRQDHRLAWPHAPATPAPARLQTGAPPLALPATRDSENQSIP